MSKTNSPFRAAIYQYKARDETPVKRIARLGHILADSGSGAFDLLVCPELFLSGYNVADDIIKYSKTSSGTYFKQISELAKTWNTAIIYGYPEDTPKGRYNSALCVSAEGEIMANHRKMGLPSDYEKLYFQRGVQTTVFEIKGYRLAIAVCYDAEFPENIRKCAQHGAEIVIVPTALVERWTFVARKMMPTRAFENGVFLLYANYCGEENGSRYLGDSRIIAPDGEELAVAGTEETVINAELDQKRITESRWILPYLEDLQ
ncbi:MAG: carbon-nitrogen hydrolase family protein [SAR324 cluster bacterium]|nr:carbon-nitrogen hydrolase family protein [SAR324 cluster bacterium]